MRLTRERIATALGESNGNVLGGVAHDVGHLLLKRLGKIYNLNLDRLEDTSKAVGRVESELSNILAIVLRKGLKATQSLERRMED